MSRQNSVSQKIAWEPGRTGTTHNATYQGKKLQIRQANSGGFTATIDGKTVTSKGRSINFATLPAAKRVVLTALGLRKQSAPRKKEVAAGAYNIALSR